MGYKKFLLEVLLISELATLHNCPAQGCSEGDVRLQPNATNPTQVKSVVQFCHERAWKSICHNSNWGQVEANTVCNQLGYSSTGATKGSKCYRHSADSEYLTNVQCDGSQSKLLQCTNFSSTSDCGSFVNMRCPVSERRQSTIRCLQATCGNKSVRLVDGPTNSIGRVEMCVDGRWGTVCNNSQEGIAGAVCSQLGFPGEGATIVTWEGPEYLPIRLCKVQANSSFRCREADDSSSCEHSSDIGVFCRTYEQLYNKRCLRNDQSPRHPICTTLNTSTGNTQTGAETCSPALGGVVGVLLTVLVVLVIGWSLSCVVLVKQHSSKTKDNFNTNHEPTKRELNNPMYDAKFNTEAHNYSSSGPTYELVDTNEGAGQTYAQLDQNREGCNTVQASAGKEIGHPVFEQGECEGEFERSENLPVADYEVPVSQQTQGRDFHS